jgi:hypothetical protein
MGAPVCWVGAQAIAGASGAARCSLAESASPRLTYPCAPCAASACRRKRCSVVQWNPEVATQLMVASDDDMSPSLQLWDLRNSVSPIKEFHGHAKARPALPPDDAQGRCSLLCS